MFESQGIIHYGPDIRLIAEIDQGIGDFYRSLIPKYYYAKSLRYKSHITIVRTGKETPTNLDLWGRHEGRQITFQYDSYIHFDGVMFWLDAYSQEIGEIRQELGLPEYRDDRAYGGVLRTAYHISIANVKNT
jgi:hypothetical protein